MFGNPVTMDSIGSSLKFNRDELLLHKMMSTDTLIAEEQDMIHSLQQLNVSMKSEEREGCARRRDSRMKKRMTSIMTTITTPNKSTPSHAQISARISDNKYAILNLLDDQFEDVRQRTLSGKGRAIAQATKEAEQRMKRLRRPVSKNVLDSTLDMLGGL